MLETLSSAVGAAAFLSVLAIVAVWIPFQRGLRVCARAAAATPSRSIRALSRR